MFSLSIIGSSMLLFFFGDPIFLWGLADLMTSLFVSISLRIFVELSGGAELSNRQGSV